MKPVDYEKVLAAIATELEGFEDGGRVATYIPELGRVSAEKFGAHLATVDGGHFEVGDAGERFSTQSISKVFALLLALQVCGRELWRRVGVEPSGSAFNSMAQLEYEKGIPRNPLINAGAIVTCDVLVEGLKDPKREILEFVRKASGIPDVDYDLTVARSEKRTGFRNYAMANLMKGFGNLRNDVEVVLDVYFHLCSIAMSCRELAQAFLFLAADGINPATREQVVTTRRAKRVNSIMQMCGFYDEAGEFAFRVGLPGKSGVGGGIVAVHPGHYAVAVWSPRLNEKGNSCKGVKFLEELTSRTRQSIF